ncbi:MAG: hypothetical protein J5858_09805 [Lentisphaeria bacterium]|nr:hypothetical protein [Lentisphaeria bacterium]
MKHENSPRLKFKLTNFAYFLNIPLKNPESKPEKEKFEENLMSTRKSLHMGTNPLPDPVTKNTGAERLGFSIEQKVAAALEDNDDFSHEYTMIFANLSRLKTDFCIIIIIYRKLH